MTTEYKPLATSFKSRGWQFSQVDRVGDVALFEKRHPDVERPCFEVVIVQKYDERTIAGKSIQATEAMPPTSMWGRMGWTPRNAEEARSKFDAVVAQQALVAEQRIAK